MITCTREYSLTLLQMSITAQPITLTYRRTLKMLGRVCSASIVTITPSHPEWKLMLMFFDSNADRMIFGSLNMCMFDEIERVKDNWSLGDSEDPIAMPGPIPEDKKLELSILFQCYMKEHASYGKQVWAGELYKIGTKRPVIQVQPETIRFPSSDPTLAQT